MFVQSSLMYIMVIANYSTDSLDLSNLLFSSSIFSKLQYTVLLLTSCTSVIIGLGRILSFGERPLVTSDNVLKMAAFILTKCCVMSYLLCMVIRSIMWYYVASSQSEELLSIMSYNYRGLCKTDQEEKSFCKRSESFSFFTVAIVIPIVGLVLLYIPSITYIVLIYIMKTKRKQLNLYYAFVCILFAILTNLSLFGKEEQRKSRKLHFYKDETLQNSLDLTQPARRKNSTLLGKTTRSQSLPSSFDNRIVPVFRADSMPTIPILMTTDSKETEVNLSFHQSNILFLMFWFSAVIFFSVDIVLQLVRQQTGNPDKVVPHISTTLALCLFLVNSALWINFNWANWRHRASRYNSRQQS